MSFDRTKPVNGTTVDANLLRNNMNDLDDRVNAGIPGPQGPPGNDGADGATGPQGPAGTVDLNNPLIVQNRLISDGADLTIATSDAGGSGETSLILSADTSTGVPLPIITGKVSGASVWNIRQDLPGIVDGGGVPSVQDGDFSRYDAATQTMKPARRLGLLFADLAPLTTPVSNPPTQADVQENRDRLNEFLTRLLTM